MNFHTSLPSYSPGSKSIKRRISNKMLAMPTGTGRSPLSILHGDNSPISLASHQVTICGQRVDVIPLTQISALFKVLLASYHFFPEKQNIWKSGRLKSNISRMGCFVLFLLFFSLLLLLAPFKRIIFNTGFLQV